MMRDIFGRGTKFCAHTVMVLLLAGALMAQTASVVPDGDMVRLTWDRNSEPDVAYYEVSTADGVVFQTADTVCVVILHAAAHEGAALPDSIGVNVRAVDWSGNKSDMTYRVGFWPQLRVDFAPDNLNRIDGEDLRRFLILWREQFGKVVQR